ncbi:hypothetical protein PMKS-003497 [Pichia membranifaciens]|uniref:Exocyst complex component Sec3 PIP2-binding N-terminal domain-containing protein n=1 Tax=Pichia membranifaciens TaxID=4926 RepID=A0A1Q2YKI5_9ASCO|nr:hypothetical protein PMKS-003497 [Pichia membranifaciens]
MGSFQPGHRPMNSMDLAKQYEIDMKKIHESLFQEVDSTNTKVESYLAHVRIIEDAKSPSSRPPPNSPQSNKKNRFLLLSVKTSGRMRLHKAKESSSGMIQIGRSWDFDELVSLELDDQVPTGFICQMGKKYYWEVHTPKERRVWCSTLVDNYIRYTQGQLPQLLNCSVDYFHLENLYDSYHGGSGSVPSQNRTPNPQIMSKTPVLSPKGNSPSTFANAQRSPSKSNSQDLTSLKKNLGNANSANSSMAAAVRGAGATAMPMSASSRSPDLDNRYKLEQERKLWEEQKQKEHLARKQQEEKRLKEAQRQAEEKEREKQLVLEEKRKQEIEKRRQQELERRKQNELERRKQEELERARQAEELERARQAEELERARQAEELEKKRQAEELERTRQQEVRRQEEEMRTRKQKQQQLEDARREEERAHQAQLAEAATKAKKPNYENQKSFDSFRLQTNGFSEIAKKGPPSGMLSNEPSQMSFEIGDEYRFQNVNASVESDISIGIDNYIDGYTSNGDEETQTAPLNLSKPRARSAAATELSGKQGVPTITTTLDEIPAPKVGNHENVSNMSIDSELNKLLTPVNHLESMEDEIDKSFGEGNRQHARSRAFSRVSESTPDSNDLLEILEEIGYDPIEDDSATLQKKLLKEMDKLQYDKIETLINVTGVSSALKQSISTAFRNCDHIDPILALFGVQLSTFKEDVDFIEEQGQGLQVEATNEKLLMNELNEIVHSVEISDKKLQILLGTKIILGYQNSELEKILNELYYALLKVSGSQENLDDDHGISKMKALQEKKKSYENVRDTFVGSFKKQVGKIFESASLSLSSKLQNVSSDNFDMNFLNTIFLDKMTSFLTIEGLIAFVKSVSVSDYYDIVDSYVVAMRPFFENLSIVLMRKLEQHVSVLNVQQFSFDSDPAALIDKAYMSSRGKKDLGSSRGGNVFSRNQSGNSGKLPADDEMIKVMNTYFLQAKKVMSIEQEVMKKLFALSSSPDLSFENVVKVPLETRCEQFVATSDFLNGTIEPDREIGDYIFDIMRQLFDSTFSSVLKILLSISKSNILETPAILCLLKTSSQHLAPTCHEYLYGNFTRLETKVNSIWIKEIDQLSQEILSIKVNCHVMNFVKAYAVFFSRIHSIVDSLNLVNLVTFGTDQKVYGNYYMLWDTIKTALNKGIESMKFDVSLHDSNVEDRDIDTDASTQKHLTLWINYKWIFEESKNLLEFPKDLSRSIDDLRDRELRVFSESFGRRYKIGNIIRLVEDLENLLSNNGNPSTFSTYSVENIKNLIAAFKGDSFKEEISNLANGLKSVLKGRCYFIGNNKENEFSIAIGEQIQKELYNNCMFALCQLYISTFGRLSSIVDQYYNNFEVPVDKYIINFNFKKNYIS